MAGRLRSSSGGSPVVKSHPMKSCILTTFVITIVGLSGIFFYSGYKSDRPMMGPLFLASIIPGFVILFVAYKRDTGNYGEDFESMMHSEKVPMEVLVLAFTFGIFSTMPVAIAGIYSNNVMRSLFQDRLTFWELMAYMFVEVYIFVAAVEEGAKYFVARYSVKRDSLKVFINHPYGVVLYGLACALGFAGIENVMYVLEEEAKTQGGLYVAIARALLSVPLHGTTGALIGVGLARRLYLGEKKWNVFRVMLIPVIIHGTYDFVFMAPFRSGPFKEKEKGHELFTEENTVDLGENIGFIQLIAVLIVFFGAAYTKDQTKKLMEDYRKVRRGSQHAFAEDN